MLYFIGFTKKSSVAQWIQAIKSPLRRPGSRERVVWKPFLKGVLSPLLEGFLKVGFDEEIVTPLSWLNKSLKVSSHLTVGM